MELEKRRLGLRGQALVSGCPEHWTIQYKLKSTLLLHRMITVHARHRQTDRRTDEHHGNSATIRSNERIAR